MNKPTIKIGIGIPEDHIVDSRSMKIARKNTSLIPKKMLIRKKGGKRIARKRNS